MRRLCDGVIRRGVFFFCWHGTRSCFGGLGDADVGVLFLPSLLPGRRWCVSASPPLAFWSSYYFLQSVLRGCQRTKRQKYYLFSEYRATMPKGNRFQISHLFASFTCICDSYTEREGAAVRPLHFSSIQWIPRRPPNATRSCRCGTRRSAAGGERIVKRASEQTPASGDRNLRSKCR